MKMEFKMGAVEFQVEITENEVKVWENNQLQHSEEYTHEEERDHILRETLFLNVHRCIAQFYKNGGESR